MADLESETQAQAQEGEEERVEANWDSGAQCQQSPRDPFSEADRFDSYDRGSMLIMDIDAKQCASITSGQLEALPRFPKGS
ncbi:hypothetical protein LRP88_06777 [Fusarium phalaenopsidis]